MSDYRYIIKTDDGRYVKSGNNVPDNFTKTIWDAKFYKNEDDAKRVIATALRFLEKYGPASSRRRWSSEFKVIKVAITEQ